MTFLSLWLPYTLGIKDITCVGYFLQVRGTEAELMRRSVPILPTAATQLPGVLRAMQVHSGQLAVRRGGTPEKPLLQMELPLREPSDPVPSDITPNSDIVKVPLQQFCADAVAEPHELVPAGDCDASSRTVDGCHFER
jgi:hypothetical protein